MKNIEKKSYVNIKAENEKRLCLKCNKYFLSNGPGNRICNSCDKINEITIDRSSNIFIEDKNEITNDDK